MKKILLVLSLISIAVFAFGQEKTKEDKKEEKKAAKVAKKNKTPEKGDIYFSPVPVIGANPAFGFIYGAGSATSWYMGDPETTKLSSALFGLALTTKSQTILTLKSTMYSENNNFIYMGDWRYLNSSQPTWGLGTGPQSAKLASDDFNFDDGSIDGNSEADMLQFKFIRFYETAFKKLGENGFYVGLGGHLDMFREITDNLLNLEADTPVITPYYAYSDEYNFKQDESTLVGVSFNGMFDTRDNINDPYTGRYVLASYKVNPDFLGSDQNSSSLWLEYRDYFNFSKNKSNILAIWTYANITTSGELPYMNLPATGWDQYAKSGEPYAQGRFRGNNLIFGGAEYRQHIWGTEKTPELLRGIVYANAFTADGKQNGIDLFDYVNFGYGLGLRYLLSKKARTYIGVDYGWGQYGTTGFYIRLNENF